MACGIYKIENNINHQVYIGQSRNIDKRWQKHKRANDGYAIHQAIQKYGVANFSFEIIEECSPEELDEREIYWITQYNSYHKGYNETKGGRGTSGGTVKLTSTDVQKIRDLLVNSNKSNKDIASEFNVSENTISGINTGYYWYAADINYPIREKVSHTSTDYRHYHVQNYNDKPKRKYTCQNCGTEIKTTHALYCPACAALMRRKVKRPSKEELQQQLQDNQGNFTMVARKYGVTDNTVRKWCTSYDLPTHSADYKIKVVNVKKGKNLPSIRVQQIDKITGNVIREFDSLSQAEQETGIQHIFQASDPNNTKRKTAGGYIWKRI